MSSSLKAIINGVSEGITVDRSGVGKNGEEAIGVIVSAIIGVITSGNIVPVTTIGKDVGGGVDLIKVGVAVRERIGIGCRLVGVKKVLGAQPDTKTRLLNHKTSWILVPPPIFVATFSK